MLPDPRLFASAAVHNDSIVELARQSLATDIPVHQEKHDTALREALHRALTEDEGARMTQAIEYAPSVDVARHIWRRLAEAFAQSEATALVTRVFVLPVVLVAGAREEMNVPAVLPNVDELAATLQAHGALAGNRNFTLGNALLSAAALDWAYLPELFRWQAMSQGAALPSRALFPAPIDVLPKQEAVHLRFIVGAAIAAARVDLHGRAEVGKWGIPLAQQIAQQLAQPGLTLLALPRAPMSPVLAVHSGRAAQREVGLQIYASNAIREFRAGVGEPTAVISAHRAADATRGGELRVSLSSPFNPLERRTAEGFRCPLYALDRVADVERAVVALLEDCRLTDVRTLPQLFPDRDPATGQRLFIRPETLDDVAAFALQ